MSPLDQQILAEVKSAILGVEPRAQVLLFGSRARGEAREDSDWDVMIVTPGEVGRVERPAYYDAIYDVDLRYDTLVSLHFITQARWDEDRHAHPFLREVVTDSLVI